MNLHLTQLSGNRYKEKNQYIDKVSSLRATVWNLKDNPNQAVIKDQARSNAWDIIKEYRFKADQIEKDYLSTLFPNSEDYDLAKKQTGALQKASAMNFVNSKQTEQSLSRTIKLAIDTGEKDFLGYAYLYYSGYQPKSTEEFKLISTARNLLGDYFSKTKLNEITKERDQIKEAGPVVEALKKEYNL